MNAWLAGTSSPVPALPSGPSVRSGSSAFSGTNTVCPLLTVWSTPWSKNCPKNVNTELYGGERPTSVVTFGMNSVWCEGTQLSGTPPRPVDGSGSVWHGNLPGLPWVRTGNAAAATAAGFVDVWSTIRLLIVRGRVSNTSLFLFAYDELVTAGLPGPRKPAGTPSASWNFGVVSRGKTSSAAANRVRSGNRLLQEPSTVRSPKEDRRSGIWNAPGPTSAAHGLA